MPTIDTTKLDALACWTSSELCAYMRIGRDRLRAYIADGLPHIQIGQGYRFERLRVKKWFNDGKAGE